MDYKSRKLYQNQKFKKCNYHSCPIEKYTIF